MSGDIFVIHYFIIFNAFRLLQESQLFSSIMKSKFIGIFYYIIIIYFILQLEVLRVNLFFELLWGVFYLNILFSVAKIGVNLFEKSLSFIENKLKFSMFNFYIMQAILFTCIARYSDLHYALSIPLVFIVSIVLSLLFSQSANIKKE